MQSLPIDAVLPDVLGALARETRLVLEAPPGAGKTTRVPSALVQASWCSGRVLVAEPRRIAARLAARRVAQEQGGKLGAEVGYQLRFEDVTSPSTRLVYLTEGILLRQLIRDPLLRGVSCVILDEFHERSLQLDSCLALLERLQRERRPELRLVVMSATLDAGPIAEYLHAAPRLQSAGRTYPVAIEHAARSEELPLEKRVRSAVRQALGRDGSVLVFLPGAAEIRRCQAALEQLAGDVEVLALHGDLLIDDQVRAVDASERRRVVLATNVAESSVTIPGVTTVIDSGLARVARHSPWSGLRSLEIEEISQARAAQRAGRAGRTAPGVAVRLYTAGNFSARPRQDIPAIEREDLSDSVLALASRGDADPAALRWLTPPPSAAWCAAVELLGSLGALRAGELTDIGRRMLRFPLHPRLARLLVEGELRGCAEGAALAAALLAERDVRRETRTRWTQGALQSGESGDSDLEDMIERFTQAAEARFSRQALHALELDASAVRSVDRSSRQLSRQLRPARPTGAVDEAEQLARCVLIAFNDRVAQRRGTGRELLLCGGTTALLAETSVVHRASWLVALSADQARGTRGQTLVRIASRIEPDWLLDFDDGHLELEETIAFEPTSERVERTSRLRYGRLVLDESRQRARPGSEAAEVLLKVARSRGLGVADPEGHLTRLDVRLALLREHGLIDFDVPPLAERGLQLGCREVTSLAELRSLDLAALALAPLPTEVGRLLREHTPLRIRLPSGRELSVNYEPGKPPWLQSRLQDFFGMAETPTICAGRRPLQVQLLAPNQRAVQVTTDLAGFWQRHYPGIRKDLMRRYPRHAWPEDGSTATPPSPAPRRRR